MLIRFGVAQIVGALPAVIVLVAALIGANAVAGKRPGLVKPILLGGVLLAVGLLIAILSAGTIVWVVDEGPAGSLAARRYLLWGDRGTVSTLDGQPLEVVVGEGVDVVVNASRADLVVEQVSYGGTFAPDAKPERLPPGRCRTYISSINDVGDPPPTAQVKEQSPVSVRAYIRRAR